MELLYINLSRFHPLLVHLPIGILLFAFFLEVMKQWRKEEHLSNSIRYALYLSAGASVFSVLTGLWLSQEGGYEEGALQLHKWMGISLAVCSILLAIFQSSSKPNLQQLYLPLFGVSLILLVLTGHYGGNITHGADYLFSRPVDNSLVIEDIESAPVYDKIIQPILMDKCNSCHNPSKAKGELVMTTQEGLLQGGETGAVFDFDHPAKSALLTRIHLPESEKKHMPPKGKKQLNEDEKILLEWWVSNKACFDCLVQATAGKDSVRAILAKYQTTKTNMKAVNVSPIRASSLETLAKAGIPVYPLAEDNPFLIVNLAQRKDLTEKDINLLKKVDDNILELNLSGSNFSDTLAPILKRFSNLQKLQLQQTAITDKTVDYIKQLKYLQSLNIYGTAVSDQSIESLQELNALENLYAWQSKISITGISKLQQEKPLLQISYAIDTTIFGDTKLSAPTFIAEGELFKDSLEVALQSNFRKVRIHFTTDGTLPDTFAQQYQEPLMLNQTTTLKTIAFKEGWGVSPVVEQTFVRSSFEVKKAQLAEEPHGKYKANGASSLVDLEKGTQRFTDGSWLGYEGAHMTAVLEMEKAEPISQVYVSALSAPGSWIHYPKGFRVWLSNDGRNYKMVKKMDLPVAESQGTDGLKYFALDFDQTEAKYVKVQALSLLKNPEWHAEPGGKCWIFIDEIVLN